MSDPETPIVVYGDMFFERVCPSCSRFVRADPELRYEKNLADEVRFNKPNATCKKCGRVNMPFGGYYPDE